MILRAIFWIGVVALFMPHEPDLGFGRPAAAVPHLPEAAAWTGAKAATGLCRDNAGACAATVSLLDDFKETAVANLARVKADIRENGSTRLPRLGG